MSFSVSLRHGYGFRSAFYEPALRGLLERSSIYYRLECAQSLPRFISSRREPRVVNIVPNLSGARTFHSIARQCCWTEQNVVMLCWLLHPLTSDTVRKYSGIVEVPLFSILIMERGKPNIFRVGYDTVVSRWK